MPIPARMERSGSKTRSRLAVADGNVLANLGYGLSAQALVKKARSAADHRGEAAQIPSLRSHVR